MLFVQVASLSPPVTVFILQKNKQMRRQWGRGGGNNHILNGLARELSEFGIAERSKKTFNGPFRVSLFLAYLQGSVCARGHPPGAGGGPLAPLQRESEDPLLIPPHVQTGRSFISH